MTTVETGQGRERIELALDKYKIPQNVRSWMQDYGWGVNVRNDSLSFTSPDSESWPTQVIFERDEKAVTCTITLLAENYQFLAFIRQNGQQMVIRDPEIDVVEDAKGLRKLMIESPPQKVLDGYVYRNISIDPRGLWKNTTSFIPPSKDSFIGLQQDN